MVKAHTGMESGVCREQVNFSDRPSVLEAFGIPGTSAGKLVIELSPGNEGITGGKKLLKQSFPNPWHQQSQVRVKLVSLMC
jgi:hypothetical protein